MPTKMLFLLLAIALPFSCAAVIDGGGGGKNVLTSDPAVFNNGITINEDGGTTDTRIEGSGDPNLFVVDAVNNRIGIHNAGPVKLLEVGDEFLVIEASSVFSPKGEWAFGGVPTDGIGLELLHDVALARGMRIKNKSVSSVARSMISMDYQGGEGGTIYTPSAAFPNQNGVVTSLNYTALNNHYFRSNSLSTGAVILSEGGIHYENFNTEPVTPVTGVVIYATATPTNSELFILNEAGTVNKLSGNAEFQAIAVSSGPVQLALITDVVLRAQFPLSVGETYFNTDDGKIFVSTGTGLGDWAASDDYTVGP